jgi:hypothetical protein
LSVSCKDIKQIFAIIKGIQHEFQWISKSIIVPQLTEYLSFVFPSYTSKRNKLSHPLISQVVFIFAISLTGFQGQVILFQLEAITACMVNLFARYANSNISDSKLDIEEYNENCKDYALDLRRVIIFAFFFFLNTEILILLQYNIVHTCTEFSRHPSGQ